MESAMLQLFNVMEASEGNLVKSSISRFICELLSLWLLYYNAHNRRVSRTGCMLGV